LVFSNKSKEKNLNFTKNIFKKSLPVHGTLLAKIPDGHEGMWEFARDNG
jgi:hypothetical protein